MPRDFLANLNESPVSDEISGRDFLAEASPSQESLGAAVLKAPFRIGGDVVRGGFNFLKNIPQYIESAKTEAPGVFDVMSEHPGHAASQALAGISELGQNVFNAPHSLINYAANRLNLVPQDINQKVQMARMPSDTQQMIDQTFGNPQYPGEELIRGISRNALNILSGGRVASVLNPMNLTSKSIAKDVLKTGEKNKNIYNKLYSSFWKEAEKKGYKDMSHVLSNIDIDTLRKYSSKKSIDAIEDFIKDPTLQNAHYAKSDLLKIQRDLGKLTTLKGAERKQFNAANNAIENIKNNMFKDKKGKVHEDLLEKYNKIQSGYSSEVVPYKHKAINEFKRNEKSAKELVNALSHGKFAAQRGKFHRAIGLRNMLGNHPYFTGAGLTGLGLYLYNNMMGNKASNE